MDRTYEFSLKQRFESEKGWYSLEYPRMWEVEVIEHIPAFFDPINGRGSVQIFAVQMGSPADSIEVINAYPFLRGASLIEKMELFLQAQECDYNPDRLQSSTHPMSAKDNPTKVVASEYRIENRFYMAAMFQNQNLFLLALYNCEGLPEESEAKAVGELLRSIDLKGYHV